MRRRDVLLTALASVLGPSLIPGCAKRAPLTLSTHHWIGYETFFIARDFGWLPTDVSLLARAVAPDTMADLRDGRADVGTLTLDEVLISRAEGTPLTVIAVLDISAGADVLISRRELTHLAELRGQRVAVQHSAVGELMLHKMLQAADLTTRDLTIVNLRMDEQLDAWQRGDIDAAISYEPVASQLIDAGGYRSFDSRRIPDTIFDVLAARRDRIAARDETLRALVANHFRGLEHLRINRQDAVHRIATHQDTTTAHVRHALAGVAFPDLSANRRLLTPTSRLHQAATTLNDLMTRRGLLNQPDNLAKLFTADFLPHATPAPL